MKFNIMCVHSKYPGRTPQLFAIIELPDSIHVGYKEWIKTENEHIQEEILNALNDNEVRDCIFTIAEKSNRSKVMKEYWRKRKLSERSFERTNV